jgi:hypothetical protein
MAEGAGDPHAGQRVLATDGLDLALNTNDCIQLQQCYRRVGALQIDAAVLDSLHHRRRQSFRIYLQANRQCGGGVDCRRDHFMHAQCIAPLRFVTESIEAEDLLTLCNQRGLIARTIGLRRTTPATRDQHSHHTCRA